MKTRNKKTQLKPQDDTSTAEVHPQTLAPSVKSPPHVFVLPKDASANARIVTLPNPSTSDPSRYFVCPEKGWYEFTRVAGPKRACRSWLLAPDQNIGAEREGAEQDGKDENEGYVLQTPDLMIATPIDPLFLLVPALSQDTAEGGKQMYLTLSDHLDHLEEKSEHFRHVMQTDRQAQGRLESLFETRARRVCDVVEAGEETLYRLSVEKLLQELVGKARKMVEKGLPASMEERFVKRDLAVPVLGIKREESSLSGASAEGATVSGAEESEGDSQKTSQETQTSSTRSTSVFTAATSVTSEQSSTADEKTTHLLRLRTGLNFLLSSYIPPPLRVVLQSLLSTSSLISFAPLEVHLIHIASLKKEAQALRSMSDNISRKRGRDEDDAEALEREETKKKRKEEDELRKKNLSRGVQQLAKADTSGMKKLSSFFTRKSPRKK